MTKIVANPRTKHALKPSACIRMISALDAVESAIDWPAIYDTYPGTSGSTQGDRNEIVPATNTAAIEVSIMMHQYLAPRPDLLPVLSRCADHGFQSVDICRALQDLIAHDEARRAVDAKRLSQRKVPVDRSLDRGIRHIRNEAIRIQADRGRDLLDLSRVDRTANLIERSMERNVLALLVRGQRRLGGERGIRSKDRKFLVGNAQLRIVFLRFDHDRRDLPAVRAIVVEELDESDIALRIPAGRGCCVAKYLIGAAFDDLLHLRLYLCALTCFQLSDGLHDDLGMGHQVVVHATFKFVLRCLCREIRDLMLPSKSRIENNPCSYRSQQNKRQAQPR